MPEKRKDLEKVWFREARHVEEITAGDDLNSLDKELWRKNKERMKTVSVALVLCLNIGVDPPDVPRPHGPRKHAWVEPVICSAQKSAQKIADSLRDNYEKLQPKARYKIAIDPTVEHVKKLAQSLRRSAKEERVLFHFNGNGVPRPTEAGEIWVFNKTITQYIPLSLYDLQTWTGSPSVYVWDCHSAGTILNMFSRFEEQHKISLLSGEPSVHLNDDTIQLGACRAGELLPQHPDLPADLFTSCLTTPIQTSILWYIIKTGTKDKYPADVIEDIPGLLTDRRTMLGELNWIFTAITDTIAWNALSTDNFQRLFRQDQLTASLFRSFLLAERVMAENNCHVVSQPALPSVFCHPLWNYWEYTIDVFLNNISQLRTPKTNVYSLGRNEYFNKTSLRHSWLVDSMPTPISLEQYNSSFFSDHLKAFEIWLKFAVNKAKPPDELPVILQVLLSQVHRVHGLELWAKFVDLGAWAVGAALSVGIFPYVLKLLQSPSKDLRGPLAFIWAKILWVDPARQQDLVKENGLVGNHAGYFYFIQILNDSYTTPRMKIVPAYVMATIIHNKYRPAQEKLNKSEYMTLCTELLLNVEVVKCKLLCQWLLIGLGRLWSDYNEARWQAVRTVAYDRIMEFLDDDVPEVRAAAVFALGCFVRNRSANNEHATEIENGICDKICETCTYDGSVLVRAELAVAIQWYIVDFETKFADLCTRLHKITFENEPPDGKPTLNSARESKAHVTQFGKHTETISEKTKEQMVNDIKFLEQKFFKDPFERMWLSLLRLSFDPFPYVSTMARRLINHIRDLARIDGIKKLKRLSESQSHSPNSSLKSDGISSNGRPNHVKFVVGSPLSAQSEASAQLKNCTSINDMVSLGVLQTPGTNFTPKRTIYGSQSGRYTKINDESLDKPVEQLVATQFVEWCGKSFQQPIFNTIYGDVSTSTRNSLVNSACPFTQTKPTDWALHTFEGLIQKSVADVQDFKKEKIKCETLHMSTTVERTITSLAWSVLRPYMITCDGSYLSLYNVNKEHSMNPLKARFPVSDDPILNDRVTDIMIANGLTHEVILTGSRNGVLKVWDPKFSEHGHEINGEPKLVTAAHLLSDQTRNMKDKKPVNQTFYCWDQPCGRVVCSGNVRIVRIWDAWAEKAMCDINFRDKNLKVSSLSAELTNNLICLGFNDGTVSVFDVRLPSSESEIMCLKDFSSTILGTSIAFNNTKIVAGARDGEFRAFEPRMYHDPLVEFNVFQNNFIPSASTSRFAANSSSYKHLASPSLHAIDIQPTGQLISCATNNGTVCLFDVFGKKCLSQFKYTSQTLPTFAPTALRFHADKVLVGVANTENHVYAYGCSNEF